MSAVSYCALHELWHEMPLARSLPLDAILPSETDEPP